MQSTTTHQDEQHQSASSSSLRDHLFLTTLHDNPDLRSPSCCSYKHLAAVALWNHYAASSSAPSSASASNNGGSEAVARTEKDERSQQQQQQGGGGNHLLLPQGILRQIVESFPKPSSSNIVSRVEGRLRRNDSGQDRLLLREHQVPPSVRSTNILKTLEEGREVNSALLSTLSFCPHISTLQLYEDASSAASVFGGFRSTKDPKKVDYVPVPTGAHPTHWLKELAFVGGSCFSALDLLGCSRLAKLKTSPPGEPFPLPPVLRLELNSVIHVESVDTWVAESTPPPMVSTGGQQCPPFPFLSWMSLMAGSNEGGVFERHPHSRLTSLIIERREPSLGALARAKRMTDVKNDAADAALVVLLQTMVWAYHATLESIRVDFTMPLAMEELFLLGIPPNQQPSGEGLPGNAFKRDVMLKIPSLQDGLQLRHIVLTDKQTINTVASIADLPLRRFSVLKSIEITEPYDNTGRIPALEDALEGTPFPLLTFLEKHKSTMSLPCLTKLALSRCRLGRCGIAQLVSLLETPAADGSSSSKMFPVLEELNLQGNSIGDRPLLDLLRLDHLFSSPDARLHTLTIDGNRLQLGGLTALEETQKRRNSAFLSAVRRKSEAQSDRDNNTEPPLSTASRGLKIVCFPLPLEPMAESIAEGQTRADAIQAMHSVVRKIMLSENLRKRLAGEEE